MNRIWTWISTHRYLWIGLGIVVCVALLAIFTISGGSATSTNTAPIENLFFWKLIIIVLIVSAVVSRRRPYLAITFAGLTVLVFLVLLGKFDGLFVWAILGLPLFAAAGIYGATRTDGRTRSFLGFASSILILFWMLLLYLGHADKINIGFLGILFEDETGAVDKYAKVIFTLALLSFALAWMFGSRILYFLALIVFLAFLGNATVNEISKRFPDKFALSGETKKAMKSVRKSLLEKIEDAVKPGSATPLSPTPTPISPKTQLPPEKQLRRVIVKRPLIAEFESDDCVSFRVDDVPWTSTARYRIAFRLCQDRPGQLFVEVNGRTGDEGRMFDFDSRLSDQDVVVVFFEDARGGLLGKAAYFRPGTNRIVFRSPGINCQIRYAQIEVEYWS